ncbi:hypothetical protein BOO71_0001687 [Deinococcus marmoris]|uniref:Uncharacterized protein n=2 Tax=Deinococcus marmoris TaxID=249408 RepID=A0A1U7P3N4_9DEIO|nr:hypothetical protein BOO71_0001687 [Deinococcus marmoris]
MSESARGGATGSVTLTSMTSDDKTPEGKATGEQRGEIVQSTVPEAHPDVIDIPAGDPQNQTPTDELGKLQQEMTRGIIPDNEDG